MNDDQTFPYMLANTPEEFERVRGIGIPAAPAVNTERGESADGEAAVDALRLIDRWGCENYGGGRRCLDPQSGRTRGADLDADAWCKPCIAADALARMIAPSPLPPIDEAVPCAQCGGPMLPDRARWWTHYGSVCSEGCVRDLIRDREGRDDSHEVRVILEEDR